MSSKRDPEAAGARRWPIWRGPTSIALRITLWYVLSAVAIVSAATGTLYWAMATNLNQEDRRILTNNLDNLRLLLKPQHGSGFLTEPTAPDASPADTQIYIRVLDRNGRLLVETPGMTQEIPPPSAETLETLPTGPPETRDIATRSKRSFKILTTRAPADARSPDAQYVQVAMDRGAEEKTLRRYRERLYLILVLAVVLSSLVGYAIARSAMRPVGGISKTAERIRSTTLHERIDTADLPTELLGLSSTFNHMLDRLQGSFDRISQFSDDVAHELRTPVNNLRGEIEVALTRARSNEDYRDILGSSLEECARISRIIESLLFLARADNAVGQLDVEEVNVRDEIASVKDFFEPSAAKKGIDFELGAPPALTARVDRTLFRQALSNLVSNAITHTDRGGRLRIKAQASKGALAVAVSDTGSGIPPADLPRVFERFYRVDKARTGSQHNVGLGLAVVRSIVVRHGGHVEIDSHLGEGTTVTMEFPRSCA